MLREDKNAWIERVELITEAEAAARTRARDAEGRVALLKREIDVGEQTIKRCEKGLEEAASARRPVDVLGFIDRLLSSRARQMKARADIHQSAVVTVLSREKRDAEERLRAVREALAAANAELATATTELVDAEATRISAYRLHGKDHFVDLPDDEYDAHAQTQGLTPVLVTTWETRNWWWFAGRFWWDSEGLDADDVQALVLQRDRKKQAILERARADGYREASGEPGADARPRREPIPESVRHEVWRRDQGRCVDCGSRERLEFDHIVPVSQGGSNTARNLELRCEPCNRRKGATI
jgi:hypothetical protein